MSTLVAYLSGHGFGHFVRSATVLERLSGTTIHVRTNARALELAGAAPWAASVTAVDVGPGVVQRGPLAMDHAATGAALAAHLAGWERTVAQEAAFVHAVGARAVYADVPPVAFAAAARAGVPSVGVGNFSWSWIYEEYAQADPIFAEATARLRAAEGAATQFLALELGGGLEVFPRRTSIAPLARRPTMDRRRARARLPFPIEDPRPIVLLSLGGFGVDLHLAARSDGRHRLLVLGPRVLEESQDVRRLVLDDTLGHADVLAAVDCLIGKPGYGTVAECLATGTPFVYLPRGQFREAPPLIAAIERHLPHAALSVEDLLAGRWGDAVERALAMRPRVPAPAGDGAAEAAAQVAALLR